MDLHIQILSTHEQSIYIIFEHLLKSIKAETLVQIDQLYLATVVHLEKISEVLNEMLFICKQHHYKIDIAFSTNTCYVTVND